MLPNLRTVAYAEIEAFACENLLARMEGGQLDAAPIWSDLKSFPWESFRGMVDILTGGYPCQPFSAAGKRAGADDPRHLWPFISAGIAAMRPSLCFFENVEGHISLGLPDVIEDLAGMGYRTTWGIFSAAEVGAPHQRKRVFVMAVASGFGSETRFSGPLTRHEGITGITDDCGAQKWPSRPGQPQHAWEPPRVVVGRMAHSNSPEPSQERGDDGEMSQVSPKQRTDHSASVSGGESQHRGEGPPRVVGHSSGKRCEQDSTLRDQQQTGGASQVSREGGGKGMGNTQSRDGQRSAQGEAGHAAQPDQGMGDPSDTGQPQRGSGTMGQPKQKPEFERSDSNRDNTEREIEPALGRSITRTSDRLDYAKLCITCDNRTDELRLLGNGVVPATAELAFKTLLNELHKDRRTANAPLHLGGQ